MLLVILKEIPFSTACPVPRTWASACKHAESFACCTCGERSLCRRKRPERVHCLTGETTSWLVVEPYPSETYENQLGIYSSQYMESHTLW